MIEGIDKEILDEFIKETIEELDGLDAKFIALEKNAKDSEVINAIFRTVHSIKGSASFFNLNHVRNFAHKLENLLDELRKGQRRITPEIVDILLKGKDSLNAMFERLIAGDMSGEFSESEQAALKIIETTLASGKEQKVETPAMVFEKLDQQRMALELEGLLDRPSIVAFWETLEDLRRVVLGAASVPKIGEILVDQGIVSIEDVQKALVEKKTIGEILIDDGKATPAEVEKAAEIQRQKALEAQAKKESVVAEKKATLKKTMRIEEEKIDGFMDLVGELIINAEVFNYLQKKLEMGLETEKLITEFKNANLDFNELTFKLQRGLAEVRKVSINGIFQKLPRMVRDLATATGKQIDFTMSGEDLLIDKSLFEQLESPMNHIIRNAVDHGIETPEDRARLGKDPMGKIEVRAEEISGDLLIHIHDDGKGLDGEKLKAKAVEKGILTLSAADTMPEKEAHKLIFAPGFSTAAKITDVSGRGVGMDVVMTTVREAKGRVDIDTQIGAGTHFTVVMPMATTLITISGLLVSVGKEHYIIPMEWVRESLKPDRRQVTSVKKKGEIVDIRDQLYPLIRMHELFNVEPKNRNPWDAVVMVIEKEDQRCCIMVDDILEETQVVLKDLGRTFSDVKGILGGAILGDGRVGLVLNVEGIMQEHTRNFND